MCYMLKTAGYKIDAQWFYTTIKLSKELMPHDEKHKKPTHK